MPNRAESRQLQPERFCAAVREDAHELVVKVIRDFAHIIGNALVVHLAAAIDVFLQPLVQIIVAPTLIDLCFVVELDFRNEQTREATRFVVLLRVFGLVGAKNVRAIDVRRRDVLRRRTIIASCRRC